MAEGAHKEALFYFSEALKNASNNDAASIQFKIAEAYELQSRLEEASSAYLKVSYMYPDEESLSHEAQLRAARLLEKQGRTDEAQKIYSKLET